MACAVFPSGTLLSLRAAHYKKEPEMTNDEKKGWQGAQACDHKGTIEGELSDQMVDQVVGGAILREIVVTKDTDKESGK